MATAPSSAASPLSPPDSVAPGGNLFMAGANWKVIQGYVQNGQLQPLSSSDAVEQWGLEQGDADQLGDLWDAFSGINDHCQHFALNTFPQTLSLTADLSDFGKNTVPALLNGAKTVAANVSAGVITQAKGRASTKAMLQALVSTAQGHSAKVAPVVSNLKGFVDTTGSDVQALAAAKSAAATVAATAVADVTNLENQIKDDLATVQAATEEYLKAVIMYEVGLVCVASTIGIVAGGILIGIAKEEMIAAGKRIQEAEAEFAAANVELKAKRALIAALRIADKATDALAKELNGAMQVITQAEQVWQDVSDTITNVAEQITDDVEDIAAFVKNQVVDKAVDDWNTVAQHADTYRTNASIVVMSVGDAAAAAAADPGQYGFQALS